MKNNWEKSLYLENSNTDNFAIFIQSYFGVLAQLLMKVWQLWVLDRISNTGSMAKVYFIDTGNMHFMRNSCSLCQ